MGFRFRKSIKLFPGVRINVGLGGVSTTVGGPGASVNLGKRGVRGTVGIPGSGLSFSQKISPISRHNGDTPAPSLLAHRRSRRLTFTTPGGTPVELDAAGIRTSIRVTTDAGVKVFTVADAEGDDDGIILHTHTGELIHVGPDDVPAVAQLLADNIPRQRQLKIAIPFAVAAFGFLALVIVIIIAAGA